MSRLEIVDFLLGLIYYKEKSNLKEVKLAKKLTLEFSPEITKLIEKFAKEAGVDKIEIVRRSLALYNYANEEVMNKENRCLAIISEDDEVIQRIDLTKDQS